MIFESAFDNLMEQIRCYKLMYICSGEYRCERLVDVVSIMLISVFNDLDFAIPVHH